MNDKDRKKVLIISYYWPPAGGGGVMRWLKMSRYLSLNNNWEPIIYTPKNAGYIVIDESAVSEVPKNIKVIQKPILEPNNFLETLGLNKLKKNVSAGGVGKKKGKMSISEKLMLWIRSNIFIPDPRFLWIRPSVKFLKEVIKKEKIDAIITTGPPHSMHVIGLKLKKELGIPWIADFRDPWTFIDFFDDLNLSKRSLERHINLEKSVLKNADHLVTVSPYIANEFKKRFNADFDVIYNGFDPVDFEGEAPKLDEKFTICHIGSLNKDRNAEVLWEAISEITNENKEFKRELEVQLIGSVTPELMDSLERLALKDIVSINEHMSHKKVINRIRKSQLLLLLINNTPIAKGILPGKFYEYLAAKRPILCIGAPDSDVAKIINECNAGQVVDFKDKNKMKETLLSSYLEFKGSGKVSCNTNNIEAFSRNGEALQFANILSSITSNT